MNQVYISEALEPKSFGYSEEIIGEDANGPIKQIVIEGEYQRAEAKNKNSRVYSEELLGQFGQRFARTQTGPVGDNGKLGFVSDSERFSRNFNFGTSKVA